MFYFMIALFVGAVILVFAGAKSKNQIVLILGIVMAAVGLGIYFYTNSESRAVTEATAKYESGVQLEAFGAAELLNEVAPDKKVVVFGSLTDEAAVNFMDSLKKNGISNATYVQVYASPIGMPIAERKAHIARAMSDNMDAEAIICYYGIPLSAEYIDIFKKVPIICIGSQVSDDLIDSGRVAAVITSTGKDVTTLPSDPAKAFAEGYTVRISD